MAVAVAPLRNLTGDPARQILVADFTDRLVADLFQRCRALSFAWAAGERRFAGNLAPPDPLEHKYVVCGSVQQGGPGMLRVNMRISDTPRTRHGLASRC